MAEIRLRIAIVVKDIGARAVFRRTKDAEGS